MMNSRLESSVRAADEARYQALYRQDAAALDRMLAADYVHTHANGKIDDKADFLASIISATYRFVLAERTEQQIRIVGSVVLLNGKTRTTLDVGGQTKVMNNAFVTVWTHREGELKLLHWQATRLAEA